MLIALCSRARGLRLRALGIWHLHHLWLSLAWSRSRLRAASTCSCRPGAPGSPERRHGGSGYESVTGDHVPRCCEVRALYCGFAEYGLPGSIRPCPALPACLRCQGACVDSRRPQSREGRCSRNRREGRRSAPSQNPTMIDRGLLPGGCVAMRGARHRGTTLRPLRSSCGLPGPSREGPSCPSS